MKNTLKTAIALATISALASFATTASADDFPMPQLPIETRIHAMLDDMQDRQAVLIVKKAEQTLEARFAKIDNSYALAADLADEPAIDWSTFRGF